MNCNGLWATQPVPSTGGYAAAACFYGYYRCCIKYILMTLQVERAIQECDGAFLAVSRHGPSRIHLYSDLIFPCTCIHTMQELVSFRHPHVQNPRLQEDYENKCGMYLESPYDEMVAAHIGYAYK